MTNTSKNMFDLVDTCELNLTMGHSNGTLAKVTHVVNLKLNNNVVLFDVLVVPEYCVSRLSVHKLIKDSKLSVNFDETTCYIHDLKNETVLGTGSESINLYLFNNQYNKSVVSNNINCIVQGSGIQQKPGMYRIATSTTQNKEPQLPHASRNTNPYVSTSTRVNHSTSVSRPPLKSYQVKDKVVPNNSQVKFTKKEVEDHHMISSISKKTKSVTAYIDSSNSRTSSVNAVCAECGKCVFNSNHDACVSKYLNDVNARTKKPKVVSMSASKPKRKTNKSVATPHKKIVASDT
ncbi:hypothetical protein Tco_1174352 [Tanacetum coccineum]